MPIKLNTRQSHKGTDTARHDRRRTPVGHRYAQLLVVRSGSPQLQAADRWWVLLLQGVNAA